MKNKDLDLDTSSGDNQNQIIDRETEGLSQRQIVIKRFVKHKAAMASVVTLASIILIVFTATGIRLGFGSFSFRIPGWWPYSISDIDPEGALASMCNGGVTGCPTLDLAPPFLDGDGVKFGNHPFGTDAIGTDYFSLVTRGAQQSIMVMVIVSFLGILIGTIVGAIAGFFGGIVDSILMRLTDMFLVTPTIVVGAVIGFKFGNLGIVPLALMLGFFAWMGLARFVRIIVVVGTLLMSGAILAETSLSYLGFGVRAPDVSLGLLISQYQGSFGISPWLFWWPGALIVSIALCVNFIGDGLRDAFDPRQRRHITNKERKLAKEMNKAKG